jgi:hypothetical protein
MSAFDFSNVEAAKGGQYLRPGMWKLTPTAVDFEQPDKGNPRLKVTFSHKDGSSLKEMFFLTPKALGRLQYLHEAWFGKKLEKAFSSAEQIGEYFKKALLSKSKEMPMLVGGEQTMDGKVYARLPYTGFVIMREDLFEEGEFEQGSARWNDNVKKKDGGNSAILASNSAVLPDTDEASDDTDDMPW